MPKYKFFVFFLSACAQTTTGMLSQYLNDTFIKDYNRNLCSFLLSLFGFFVFVFFFFLVCFIFCVCMYWCLTKLSTYSQNYFNTVELSNIQQKEGSNSYFHVYHNDQQIAVVCIPSMVHDLKNILFPIGFLPSRFRMIK